MSLTREEKNTVLTTFKIDILNDVLNTLYHADHVGDTIKYFESLEESCALLSDFYQHLTNLEKISDLRSKKSAIQHIIHQCINRLLSARECNTEQTFNDFIRGVERTMGSQHLRMIFTLLRSNASYPNAALPEWVSVIDQEDLVMKIYGFEIILNSDASSAQALKNFLAISMDSYIQSHTIQAGPAPARSRQSSASSGASRPAYPNNPPRFSSSASSSSFRPTQAPQSRPHFFSTSSSPPSNDLPSYMNQMKDVADEMNEYVINVAQNWKRSNHPLVHAISCRADLQEIKNLAIRENIGWKDEDENNLLHVASVSDHPEVSKIIRFLASKGVGQSQKNLRGLTPSIMAVCGGSLEATKAFFDSGVGLSETVSWRTSRPY